MSPRRKSNQAKTKTGQNPSARMLREAERVARLYPQQQRKHPSAVVADPDKLNHIHTYGALPEFYLDRPFVCRHCGRTEIWRAQDQKWYYEDAKGHLDAVAVACYQCRTQGVGSKPGSQV